ncbi:30S ribosomal protein S2 [Phycisphaera mikurensis]|uniref:Small ribosomal subunit protein uS2 n=1 Tax=Phycisphaera mikurensis (strain NBRC 102666 / KCTC 22515 / FYK2301M01) TaxID=1142394 RepID=I0IGA5_PHYMF|nr:30S ribosomal protein S2 [Phycisphaera mikurensis]MBB6440325.1 small subunit ribosomal protein S2 [Phycisphaera mikurensis]BAM04293.1 30S ribosomal protein S2 [Phycisphaera mikurensis NBRC 102666]
MADSTPASPASSSPASLVKSLIDAGIHFGHRANSWNPKMTPYIFGKRNRIHIIDVKETIKGLLLARKFITKEVAAGKDVLFVGTKRQARSIVESHVKECGMHYVTERWLGGTLTNFSTIRQRLKRLEELEQLEESGEIANYSKKMEATLNREKSKIKRNLEGIRNMGKLPGLMVIIDVNAEQNAVKEARKLGIPIVALLDTDSNPDDADIAIPGNDDAMRAIEIVVDQLARAANEGRGKRPQSAPSAEGMVDGDGNQAPGDPRGPKGPGGRRSNRAQFSAKDTPGETAEEAQGGTAAEPIDDGKVDGATADKPAHQPAATV